LRAQRGKASQVGKWTTPPFPIPTWAINAAMLPTGKVLFYSYIRPSKDSAGRAALWDPSKGTGPDSFTEVDPPLIDVDGDGDLESLGTIQRVPSGDLQMHNYPHLFELPSGDVILAGPNHDDTGLLSTDTFTWTNLPQLDQDRIYSAAVLRPEGPQGSSKVTV